MTSTTTAVLGVARAPFLLLPVTLVAAGAAAGAYEGAFSWPATLLALVGLVALHASVNALNEASDIGTGIDYHTTRTPFSGGSGTLPSGAMAPRTAWLFGLLMAAVGLAVGVWFLLQLGWVFVPVLVIGAVCVLAYTDVLARMGLGEIAAGLGLGALPVAGASLVQGGRVGEAAVAAAIPAFLMTFNLLLLNEFPDEEPDRAGGRRNLVLLFGRRGAARIYAAAALATPIVIVGAVLAGALPPLALGAAVPSAFLAAPLRWALGDLREQVSHAALGANVAWNLATNSVMALALAVSLWRGW